MCGSDQLTRFSPEAKPEVM